MSSSGDTSVLPGECEDIASAATVKNALEVQVFGLRRSGNHAVIAWIAQQYRTPITFLNNARPFRDPFATYLMGRVPNAVPLRKLNQDKIEELRSAPKNLLLISYEDLGLWKLAKMDLLPQRRVWLGESGSTRRLLLLRDFYNWIASRVRLLEIKGRAEDIVATVDLQTRLWITYAREFCGETRYLGDLGIVGARFDRWSLDESYRLEILDKLGIAPLNNSRSTVPRAGGGSSFDGIRFSGSAEEMDVLNRWTYLKGPEYRPLLQLFVRKRAEIDRYNRRIFGMGYPFEGDRPL